MSNLVIGSEDFLSCLCLKVLYLNKSYIYVYDPFELILVEDVRFREFFFLFSLRLLLSNIFSTISWKGYIFPLSIALHIWQKSDTFIWVYLFILCSVPLIFASIPLLTPYCLDHHCYVVKLSWGRMISSTLLFFCKIALAVLIPVPFCIHFRLNLSIFPTLLGIC